MGNFIPQSSRAAENSKRGRSSASRKRRHRYKALHVEQLESRVYLAGDLAASSAVVDEPSASISLQITDVAGNVIETVQAGDKFVLHVLVTDHREEARGVFGAYTDVRWDAGLANIAGLLTRSETYNNVLEGAVTPGLIDDAGACAFLSEVGPGTFELFSLQLEATTAGDLVFTSDAADNKLFRDVLVYGLDEPLDRDDVSYGSASVKVVGTAPSDAQEPSAPQAGPDAAATSEADAAAPVAEPTLGETADVVADAVAADEIAAAGESGTESGDSAFSLAQLVALTLPVPTEGDATVGSGEAAAAAQAGGAAAGGSADDGAVAPAAEDGAEEWNDGQEDDDETSDAEVEDSTSLNLL